MLSHKLVHIKESHPTTFLKIEHQKSQYVVLLDSFHTQNHPSTHTKSSLKFFITFKYVTVKIARITIYSTCTYTTFINYL